MIYKSRYAKYLDQQGRREDWPETVDRLISYYGRRTGWVGPIEDWEKLANAIRDMEVMPSMRAMMTAGPALDRCDVAAYNCCYLPIDSFRSFDEAMYVLMCGTGVGFSVESKYVRELPRIPEALHSSDDIVRVADSKEGWARGLRDVFRHILEGRLPRWDCSGVRPAGARLRTFGGRASGPEPLEDLFRFVVSISQSAKGRHLSSLECHDLMCKIGEVVVVGGVRRSALISLFDCTDERMLVSKSGAWWEQNGQRALANNSAVYENRRPDTGFFLGKMKALYDSKSGEPGFFSRHAAQKVAERTGRRDPSYDFGCNPCSEIILRPYQMCNLTEIVVRSDDTRETLLEKARIASILGTIQSTFTNFKYLRKVWRDNCEEERLLGVSLTGVMDNHSLMSDREVLRALKEKVVETNKEWAGRLFINQSTATTCIKPSGTVSQLVDSASGMHVRHGEYYIRTIRSDNKDPVTQFLKGEGVYNEPDWMKPENTTVFFFPVKAPDGAVTRSDQGALDVLDFWKLLQEEYCEHKPSVTVSVREDEWVDVAAWMFRNFDDVSGVAFLPYDGHVYKQAPYTEVSKEEYERFLEEHPTPSLDWSRLPEYEKEDMTTGSQELACTGNVCEVVTIGRIDD